MATEVQTLRPAEPAPGSAQVGLLSPTWAEVVFHTVVLTTMLSAVALRQSPLGHSQLKYPGATLLIFTIQAWLPLLMRTRWPVPVLVAVVIAESLHLIVVPFVDPGLTTPVAIAAYQPVPLATMAAAWTVASRRPWQLSWAVGGGAAVVLLIVSLLARPHTLLATDMVMFDLVVMATGAGVFVTTRRNRIARQARQRIEETRRQVVGERLRIARDLHDVLAHHLTLVNAQAGVADYLLKTDPKAASTALHDITENTRHALDELRATVGLLRQDGDAPDPSNPGDALHPVPGLDRLDDLLTGFRIAGTTINVTTTGTGRPLAASTDLAAYRIVQEALTNATKHAPGAQVDVSLHWLRRRLDLSIANGPGRQYDLPHHGTGTGHGLIGMRERALSCGGSLTTEATAQGGFVVQAILPVDERHEHRHKSADRPSTEPITNTSSPAFSSSFTGTSPTIDTSPTSGRMTS